MRIKNQKKHPIHDMQSMDIHQLFQIGFSFHGSGQLDKAQLIYKQVLLKSPHHFDSLHLSGVIEIQNRNFVIGLEFISQALEVDPVSAEAHSNRGLVLLELNRIDEAIISLNQASTIKPNYFLAHYNLGNALFQKGDLHGALQSLSRAIEIAPQNPESYNNRGNILTLLGKFDDAIESFEHAIKISPKYSDAYCNISNPMMQSGQLQLALEAVDKSISLNSNNYLAFSNRGNILTKLGLIDEAILSFHRSIELMPNFADSHSNLAVALFDYGKITEAMQSFSKAADCYAQAITLGRVDYHLFSKLGKCLLKLNRTEEAQVAHESALKLNPDDAESHMNLATIYFSKFEFESAWKETKWRNLEAIANTLGLPDYKYNPKPSITDKLLILCEQGIGDQILFCSILPELIGKYINIYIVADSRLIRLLQRSFPYCHFLPYSNKQPLDDFDSYLYLGDLGGIYRNHVADFPKPKPYLISDNFRTAVFKGQIDGKTKFNCGISWRSDSIINGKNKSIPLDDLLCILKISDLSFVNLQHQHSIDDVQLFNNLSIDIFEFNELDCFFDLDGLACAITACDFVVTISNSTAHIAGALGKEVLLLLPYNTGRLWYWNEYQGRNLWYPNIKVFQQRIEGDWSHPLAELQTYLEQKIA